MINLAIVLNIKPETKWKHIKINIFAHNHLEIRVLVAKRQLRMMCKSIKLVVERAITLQGLDAPTLPAFFLQNQCVDNIHRTLEQQKT